MVNLICVFQGFFLCWNCYTITIHLQIFFVCFLWGHIVSLWTAETFSSGLLHFANWISDDNDSPGSQTCSKCDLCHGAHGGHRALSHHPLGGVGHVGPGHKETRAGQHPAAPAVPEPLGFRGAADVGTGRGWLRCRWHCAAAMLNAEAKDSPTSGD